MRELEIIAEESENRALRDIKVSKNCSDRQVSKPATESFVSFRMPPSGNIVEKISTPLGKFEKNDGFTIPESCLRGRGDSISGKPESVIEIDDDVPETTNSGFRYSDSVMKDEKSEDSNVHDDPVIKDMKFNIRESPASSFSTRNNGTSAYIIHHFMFLSEVDLKIVQNSMQVLETFGCQVGTIKISEDGKRVLH